MNKYEKYFENKDHFAKEIKYSLEELAFSVSNVYWKIGFFIAVLIAVSLVLKLLEVKSFMLNPDYAIKTSFLV